MFFINEIQGGPWVAQMQVKLFKVFILKGSHRSCAAHARRWWCFGQSGPAALAAKATDRLLEV